MGCQEMPRPFLSIGRIQLFLAKFGLFYHSAKLQNLKGNINLSYFVITIQPERICDAFFSIYFIYTFNLETFSAKGLILSVINSTPWIKRRERTKAKKRKWWKCELFPNIWIFSWNSRSQMQLDTEMFIFCYTKAKQEKKKISKF